MATFNKFNVFAQDLGRKVHNLNADVLKIALTDSAPVATNTVLANITQITAANGYTSGGATVGSTAYSQSSGTGTLVGDATGFTASGGSIGPFRYAVLYNATALGGPLIGWWDIGAEVTVTSGNNFTVKPSNAATGGSILTLV